MPKQAPKSMVTKSAKEVPNKILNQFKPFSIMQVHYVEESSDVIIGEEPIKTISREPDFPQACQFCRNVTAFFKKLAQPLFFFKALELHAKKSEKTNKPLLKSCVGNRRTNKARSMANFI